MEIRGSRQYITAGFDSFEHYCKARWDIDRSWANKQIGASQVVDALEDGVDRPHLLANMEQAKALIGLLVVAIATTDEGPYPQNIEPTTADKQIQASRVMAVLSADRDRHPGSAKEADLCARSRALTPANLGGVS